MSFNSAHENYRAGAPIEAASEGDRAATMGIYDPRLAQKSPTCDAMVGQGVVRC